MSQGCTGTGSGPGCVGPGDDGRVVADKVRLMGFARSRMPKPLDLTCTHCEGDFQMTHFETSCPGCGMVYAVTPCHAGDPASVKPAGPHPTISTSTEERSACLSARAGSTWGSPGRKPSK